MTISERDPQPSGGPPRPPGWVPPPTVPPALPLPDPRLAPPGGWPPPPPREPGDKSPVDAWPVPDRVSAPAPPAPQLPVPPPPGAWPASYPGAYAGTVQPTAWPSPDQPQLGIWPGPASGAAVPPVLVPPTGRLSDDEARAARLAVPYVGPDPAPSRIAGRVVIGVLVVAIVSRLAAAVVFLQRASLEGQMADQLSRRVSGQGFDPAAYDSAAEALAGNRHTAAVIGVTYLLVVLGIIVTFFLWRDQRRPKDVLAAHGETHVESPLRWIQTGSQRLVLFGAIMASLFVGLLGSASAATSYAELHDKRMWSALACLGWAGVWALQILVVLRSERAHAERLAASAPYRAGQLPTPIFAPLANGDRPAQTGESEGLLWILRSAGLFLAGLISGGILIGAIAEHTLASLPFIVVAAPVFGLVVRAYVRRFQRKAARRAAKAAAPPAYAGYPGSW